MKKILFFLCLLISYVAQAQKLYIKTFGKPQDKVIIYLHGGPGYNCVNFEATAAQKLSNQGFFVIVYDRRGEGRSEDKKALFTFQQTFDDLNSIYDTYQLKQSVLIGHSFGGIVATLFAEKYPEKIRAILLAGAPVSLQESFKHIITTCKTIYADKKDSNNLKYISMLETMDTTSLMYSSYCFQHAMMNGFYTPKKTTAQAQEIYATFKTDTLLKKYAAKMTFEGPKGFFDHEKYTTINLTNSIKNLLKKKIKFYGIYGKDDGLYSADQIKHLQNLIGKDKLLYLDQCSHNAFIDQQEVFLNTCSTWFGKE